MLVEELGIEPGPELRDLEERILAQDPDLGWQPPPSAAAPVQAGRGEPERHDVRRPGARAGAARRPARRGATAPMAGSSSVSGEPGIGKTRLCEELDGARARAGHARRVGAGVGGRRRPRVLAVGAGPAGLRRARCPKRRSPPRSMAAAPTSPVSSPTTAASSPRPTTRPTPRPRDSGSSKQWPRCCTVSPTTHRSSSCSTTSTGPTRARCDCWSSPSRAASVAGPARRNLPRRRGANAAARERRSPRWRARPISNGSRSPASPSTRSATTSPQSSATTPAGDLADSLHDRTAGNPFFVGELVRLLQDEGKLETRRGDGGAGRCARRAPHPARPPTRRRDPGAHRGRDRGARVRHRARRTRVRHRRRPSARPRRSGVDDRHRRRSPRRAGPFPLLARARARDARRRI